MNKYTIVGVIIVGMIGAGMIYRQYFLPNQTKPVATGNIRNVTVVAKKNQWRFVPNEIEVTRGDTIVLEAINEDDYDHGLAIEAFGISQRMPAKSKIHATFVVTQEGEFPFYCSVPCGEGHTEGAKRTHFDMIGKLKVKSVPAEATQ